MKRVREIENSPEVKSYDEKVLEKYAHEFDLCRGNYDEKGKVNTDIACFKYDWTMLMTKQELKTY